MPTQPNPTQDVVDILKIKQAFRALSFEDRVSLCDAQGVHFAYLEAVLNQPGRQQSTFTADVWRQLVDSAAARWPRLGFAAPNPDTHCPECHEPLSEFGHCWQHHYPPMDPAQDAPQPADYFDCTCGTELNRSENPQQCTCLREHA